MSFRFASIAGVALAACTLIGLGMIASRPAPPPPPPVNILDNAIRVMNGTPLMDLTTVALTSTALASDPRIIGGIEADPGFEKFFAYLIQCALPSTATVSLALAERTVDFYGGIGLAPEWQTGPCGEACQEWVSACLYARTNVFGVTVQLYLSADHPSLDESDPEGEAESPIEEGAFYGNFFLEPPTEYSCRGTGHDPLMMSFRVCARPGHLCGIQNVGPCGEIDGETGLPTTRRACTGKDGRVYTSCRNRPTIEGTDEYPEPSKEYTRIITTHVRKTTFADGLRAGECVTDPPDGGAAPDSGLDTPGTAGSKCNTDDDCPIEGLQCETRFPNYSCTGACLNSARIDYEEADCGGVGSTCLHNGTAGVCTSACTPGQSPGQEGSCLPGQVCTGWGLLRATPDRSGCAQFCSMDSDCNGGAPCSPRTGSCGAPPWPDTYLPDGSACTYEQQVCRGLCFNTGASATSTVGVCGSLMNTAVQSECYDDPDRISPITFADDDIGICIFKSCRNDIDCEPPLTCEQRMPGQLVCTIL